MTCREFRRHHVAYVDDLLSATAMASMHDHVAQCATCGGLDVRIRRSLLLARNLPTIEPSPDFLLRLNARLAEGDEGRGTRSHIPKTMLCVAAVAGIAVGVAVTSSLAAAPKFGPNGSQPEQAFANGRSASGGAPGRTLVRERAPRPAASPDGDSTWQVSFVVDRHPISFGANWPGRADAPR